MAEEKTTRTAAEIIQEMFFVVFLGLLKKQNGVCSSANNYISTFTIVSSDGLLWTKTKKTMTHVQKKRNHKSALRRKQNQISSEIEK